MDPIEQAFANITVADFIRETSAVIEQPAPNSLVFNTWVDRLVKYAKHLQQTNRFHAFSILVNSEMMRTFHPDEDETAYDYAIRLQREATAMKAKQLFTVCVAPGRSRLPDDDPPNVDRDDMEQLEAALNLGVLNWCLCWYAEDKARKRVRRAGVVALDGQGKIVNEDEGYLDPAKNPFEEVLGG